MNVSHPNPNPTLNVPHLNATPKEVREYITMYFMWLDDSLSHHDAEVEARKIALDGNNLYKFTEENWTNELGYRGFCVYRTIQKSKYSYVCTF